MWRLLLCLGLAAGGFAGGWRVHDWRDGAAETEAVVRVVHVVERQGAINTAAAAKDATTQAQIRTVTRTITKEIPTYVTPETDRRFPLPVGLVRVHDAAVLGRDVSAVHDAAGRADDQASDVTASVAGGVLAGNAGECRADQARLTDLQDWVAAQAKAVDAPH